jgi:hypothetical protein
MRAREALDLMAQALALPAAENLAVMTISPSPPDTDIDSRS